MTTTSRLAGGTETEARTAPTTANQLRVLADWLEQHAVPDAAITSIGTGWEGVLHPHLNRHIADDSAISSAITVTGWVDDPSITAVPVNGGVHLHVAGRIAGLPTMVNIISWGSEAERIADAVTLGADHEPTPVPLDLLRRLANPGDKPALTGPLTADQLAAARTDAAQTVAEIKSEIRAEDDADSDPLAQIRAAGSAISDGLLAEVRKFAEADRAAEERADDRTQVQP